jgi:hypothetical protein
MKLEQERKTSQSRRYTGAISLAIPGRKKSALGLFSVLRSGSLLGIEQIIKTNVEYEFHADRYNQLKQRVSKSYLLISFLFYTNAFTFGKLT